MQSVVGTMGQLPGVGPVIQKIHRRIKEVRRLEKDGKLLLTRHPKFRNVEIAFDELVETEDKLRRIAIKGQKIVVGPWVSEVGFEVLYWVPFVRWFKRHFKLPPSQLAVISRGGCRDWYQGITDEYYDIFDYFTVDQYNDLRDRRIEEIGGQKQIKITESDKTIVNAVADKLPPEGYRILHPAVMFRTFRFCWNATLSLKYADLRTIMEPLQYQGGQNLDLPEDYVSAKFYFSLPFPATEENLDFCRKMIAKIAKKRPVVLLNTGFKLDDHGEMLSEELVDTIPDVISAKQYVTLQNNLDVQTEIVARSKQFVGTYGGFSYLGPFYGLPSLCFYSDRQHFKGQHLDFMNWQLMNLNKKHVQNGNAKVNFVCVDAKAYDQINSLTH